ncbi:glycosyltransferase [Ferrimonas futtsuensis]|uniref:glycosyltransferase n=1 Tax=Ferrimonas futtsuensis TaxID=364764 RepID=UPI0003FE472E|nr:glycosyltransferase [Ferrimonas futtsuensis]
MNKVLQIISDIDRPSGIKAYSDNFFKQPKLKKSLSISSFSLTKLKTISDLRELYRLMNNSQLVYNHELYSLKALLVFFISIFSKCEMVIVSHGNLIVEKDTASRRKKKFFLFIVKQCLRFTSAKTQYLNDMELNRSQKITNFSFICPPYCKINSYGDENELNTQISTRFRFCYLGANYFNRKGFDRMFSYIKLANESGYNCSLDLIGVNPTEEIRHHLIEIGLTERVNFISPIYGRDKIKLLREYDALMLLSRSEGWPVVIQEACQIGLPTLVSRETNVSDFVVENSLGLAWNDKDMTIGQQLNTLKNMASERQKIQNGFQLIEGHIGFEKLLDLVQHKV